MQVAATGNAPVIFASRVPNPSQSLLPPVVDSVLEVIANSTSLSPSEKTEFIQDLANIMKAGGDPKLIAKLLKAILALIAMRKPGMYPQETLADAEAQYRKDMGTNAAATVQTSTMTDKTDVYA